ncbi:30S ribosomal protein S4e [Candidatus Woesearchaeota archaeon]|nr:30S ribosomal protein S4e [Candidatus Woesearchaeota archaeon]
MGKSHLKRLAANQAWNIKRKHFKFITKPSHGYHGLGKGMAFNTLLKEILNYATTTKEVKKILNSNYIRIDYRRIKDFKFPVGLFDTIEFTNTSEYFRVIFNSKGKIELQKISKDESSIKPCKIIGKKMVKGKLQLNLFDGKNIFVDNNSYRVGDTIVISLLDKKIIKHLKLDKKSTIFLTGGKHIGEIGNVVDMVENKIIYKDSNDNLVETLKKYAFVIGDEKSMIKL